MKQFKLTDLEGIGPAKEKKLKEAGINSPMDFIIRGAKEVSRVTDIAVSAALELVHDAKKQIAESGTPVMLNSLKMLRELKKLQVKYPVNVEEIDRATNGGFETQSVYEIYGAEGAGKTQLTFSITSSVMKNNDSTWFIDCEYDLVTDSEDLLYLIDTKALDVSTNHNVKVIVIDGLIGLIRMLYHGRGELADRQDVIEKILIKLRNLAVYNNLCVIITNQVMSNPDPFGAKTVAVGGHVFGHNVKYIYSITKGMKNNRTFRLIKSPTQPQADYIFYLTEEGVSETESIKKIKKVEELDSHTIIKKDLLTD